MNHNTTTCYRYKVAPTESHARMQANDLDALLRMKKWGTARATGTTIVVKLTDVSSGALDFVCSESRGYRTELRDAMKAAKDREAAVARGEK